MTIISHSGGGHSVASSGTSAKLGAMSSRYSSSTRLRRGANSMSGAGTSSAGGHPLTGADPLSLKKDIKHRFEITGKLGSGTYGKVSLAFDHKMEREVAVKLIKKSAIENKQDLVRIRREIRIMSMLNHPNIIQIYEVFENKDKIILVMEYASGGELYDHVSKNGCLPESEARRIFRQITSAALYCHKHKVAHRDLKLENILLDAKNNAKIADFGLSNYFGGGTRSLLMTFCGSPLYASPEIINGTPYKGPEVDCWSLGILLYTLVYGSMPFDGRDFNRMVRQIKRGAYYEPDTPSTASMLIRNMLRVNPERRATIYDIANHWWLNLEENMPVIQELPENQITDPTPLNERAEIMVVQELADETDVFMEFGHLSAVTRRKIEEFRRRRKEAEEYIDNSPIKPPKAKKMAQDGTELEEMSSQDKSLRAVTEKDQAKKGKEPEKERDPLEDPLERLKALESRLQIGRQPTPTKQIEERSEKGIKAIESAKPEGTSKEVTEGSNDVAAPNRQQRRLSKRQESLNKKLEEAQVKKTSDAERPPVPGQSQSGPKKPGLVQKKQDVSQKQQEPQQQTLQRKNSSAAKIQKEKGQALAATDTKKAEKDARGDNETISKQQLKDGSPLTPTSKQRRTKDPQSFWKIETDSLNALMNQVLEQMECGPVSLNLVAKIQAHPMYDERPMVKELLESILETQSPAVQREASKLISKQQSKTKAVAPVSSPIKKAAPGSLPPVATQNPPKKKKSVVETKAAEPAKKESSSSAALAKRAAYQRNRERGSGRRPWNSVEVGFSAESSTASSSSSVEGTAAINNEKMGTGSRKVSSAPQEGVKKSTPAAARKAPTPEKQFAPKFVGTRETRSEEPLDEEYSTLDDEDEDEFYDVAEEEEEMESEIDGLAEVVEQIASRENDHQSPPKMPCAPKIVESMAEGEPPMSPSCSKQQQPECSGTHLTATSGLAKRISKGKYQHPLHTQVEMYGRGVSTEAESPPPTKRKIGGPQPRPENSPVLFEKAKDAILQYPVVTPTETDEDESSISCAKKSKAGTQQQTKKSVPKEDTSKNVEATKDEDKISASDQESEDEEEEEEESESQPFRPRPSTIIGFRTIQPSNDGVKKEAPIVKVVPQNQPQTQPGQNLQTDRPSPVTSSTPPQKQQQKKRSETVAGTKMAKEYEQSLVFVPVLSGEIGVNTPDYLAGLKRGRRGFDFPSLSRTTNCVTNCSNNFADVSLSYLTETTKKTDSDCSLNKLQVNGLMSQMNSNPPVEEQKKLTEIYNSTTPNEQKNNWYTESKNDEQANRMYRRNESAAAYIRRKNRERRMRSATIAVTSVTNENVVGGISNVCSSSGSSSGSSPWTSVTRFPVNGTSEIQTIRETSTGIQRRSASRHHKEELPQNIPSRRTRDGSQLVESAERKLSSTSSTSEKDQHNYLRQAYVQNRPKKLSSMSQSQSLDEAQAMPTQSPSFANGGRGESGYFAAAAGGLPSNLDRYEEEVYNAFAPTKALWQQNGRQQRERFEVYKTMAERAQQQQVEQQNQGGHSSVTGGSLRSNGGHHQPGERPLSAYVGNATTKIGRSRFNDSGNFMYRRSAYEPEFQTGGDYGGRAANDEPTRKESSSLRYRRQAYGQGRGESGSMEVGGHRSNIRSQSNDHLSMLGRSEDFDDLPYNPSSGPGSRYYPPSEYGSLGMDPIDYAYVNYYESGAAEMAQPHFGSHQQPDLGIAPHRSILKNKQAYETEPRTTYHYPTGIMPSEGSSRLRRHFSMDKGMDMGEQPTDYGNRRQHCYGSNEHLYAVGNQLPSYAYGSAAAASGGGGFYQPPYYQQQNYQGVRGKTPTEADPYDLPSMTGAASNLVNKKRGTGLLNMARRRTTEVRMPLESVAKQEDELMKRPRSPIDRIKSLFGGGTKTKPSTKDQRESGAYGTTAGYGGTTVSPMTGVRLTSAIGASTAGNYQIYQPLSTSPGRRYGGGGRYGSAYGASQFSGGGYGSGRAHQRSTWYEGDTHL